MSPVSKQISSHGMMLGFNGANILNQAEAQTRYIQIHYMRIMKNPVLPIQHYNGHHTFSNLWMGLVPCLWDPLDWMS